MIDYEDAERTIAGYAPQQEDTTNRQTISIGLSFSLQLRTNEGIGITGDASMSKTAMNVPLRASKPVQVTTDIEQEYDDNSVTSMPRSAVRFRSTTQPQEPQLRTTGPIAVARTSNRVTGTTRLGLIALLILCVAFLANGIVLPMLTDMQNRLHYGDALLATYDLDNKHFLTEEDNGRMRIVVSDENGAHEQVLVTSVSGAPHHALVTLSPAGNKVDVSINGAYIALLVPDNKGGYQWGSN